MDIHVSYPIFASHWIIHRYISYYHFLQYLNCKTHPISPLIITKTIYICILGGTECKLDNKWLHILVILHCTYQWFFFFKNITMQRVCWRMEFEDNLVRSFSKSRKKFYIHIASVNFFMLIFRRNLFSKCQIKKLSCIIDMHIQWNRSTTLWKQPSTRSLLCQVWIVDLFCYYCIFHWMLGALF